MLMTDAQVEELMSKLSELSGLDERLVAKCGGLIRAGQYDAAISQGFVLLEEQLREALGALGGTGVQMSQRAFGLENGKLKDRLHRRSSDDGEVTGIQNLFVGAFQAFRNTVAHSSGYELDEARAIIQLVNLLLIIVEQTRRPAGPEVPAKVAEALGPGATGRLREFLAGLQSLEVRLEPGKDWWPLKAILDPYQIPGHESPSRHAVAIFYLQVKNAELLLNGGGLARVVGLDLKALEWELTLKGGFVQTTHSNTPVKLSLRDRNDEATFERIIDIVGELVVGPYGAT
jgi:uncharacterized protein (TIGR02391 family)